MRRPSSTSLILWTAALLLVGMTCTGCDLFDSNGGGGGDDGGGDDRTAAPITVYVA